MTRYKCVCTCAVLCACACLTQPQGQALRVKEQVLSFSLVSGRHVEIAADDSLQVAVLPVQVARFHGTGEHSPSRPGQRV